MGRPTVKNERKMGMESVGKTLTNAQALAIVKANEPIFERVDDLKAQPFCKKMKEWRENKADVYEAFWWWRKTAEDAAKATADDDGADNSVEARCFEVMQYLAPTFSDAWNEDRRTLKDGVVPLITEAQIEKGLAHRTIKRWGWGWHNHCVYTETEEAAARPDQPIVAGQNKFNHVHVMLDCPNKCTVDTIARWFGVPSNYVKAYFGRNAFTERMEYLLHESPKAVKEGKVHYEDDEIHVSPGYDFRKDINRLQVARARYGKSASEMTPADIMRLHVLDDGWTLRECKKDDILTYSKIHKSLPALRLDYLMDQPPCPFRLNIYVDGNSGLGKSSFCEAIAESMFPAYEYPYFTLGNDERVTFDGYDGEPVVIWEEKRGADIVKEFGRGALTLLDTHPKRQSQQAKGTRIILTNAVNIINGIQPFREFLDELIAAYEDEDGRLHRAEPKTQAYRRMPFIICVHEDDFDIYLNSGFMNNDLAGVFQFDLYRRVVGSIKSTMEQLDGPAKRLVLGKVTAPILQAVDDVRSHHDDKVTEVEAIPETFANYGETIDGKEAERMDAEERERNRKVEAVAKDRRWLRKRWEYYAVFVPLWMKVSDSVLIHDDFETPQKCLPTYDQWSHEWGLYDGDARLGRVDGGRANGFDSDRKEFYHSARLTADANHHSKYLLDARKAPFGDDVKAVLADMDVEGLDEFMDTWARELASHDALESQGISIDALFPDD